MIARLLAPLALGLVASFLACSGDDGGDVGAPCNVDDDCAAGLVCDEHEGQASCQEPHGHGETGETEHDDTEHEATGHEDTEHEHASESGGDHDTGGTGHASEDTGHSHDSGDTGHGSGSETGTGTGG